MGGGSKLSSKSVTILWRFGRSYNYLRIDLLIVVAVTAVRLNFCANLLLYLYYTERTTVTDALYVLSDLYACATYTH